MFTCLDRLLHNSGARVAGKQKRRVCAGAPSDLSHDRFIQRCVRRAWHALSKYLCADLLRKQEITIIPLFYLNCQRGSN